MISQHAKNYAGVVRQQAQTIGDRQAFCFIKDMTTAETSDTLSYRDLDEQARRLAGWLCDRAEPGDRVLLCFPPGLDFVVGFFGCLYAGMVAVPAPMPEGFSSARDRVARIVEDAGIVVALSDSAGVPILEKWLAEQFGTATPCGPARGLDPALDAGRELPEPDTDALALLQYTSGSTSEPKGVMITHGNLLSNMELISECADVGPHARGFGWLPVIHDMGLIGQILWMAYIGGTMFLASPTDFLRRPYRWLELIDELDIDFTVAPNFAYELCVRTLTPERIAKLDLSGWQVTFNGAEPIQAATLKAFAEKFAPAGFRPQTYVPCYGLAEATLMVSGKRRGIEPTTAIVDADSLALGKLVHAAPGSGEHVLVGSGAVDRSRVLIVDPARRLPLSDGNVGEVWVRGASVARGYWRQDALTAEVFDQSVAGESGYFRTGDLGVIDSDELFITGRLKDVLIVRGRNLYPQDLELAVRRIDPRLDKYPSAVFALEEPADSVVIVQEIRPRGLWETDYRDLAGQIRATLVREFSIPLPSIVFVAPGSVLRTTSGKIQRTAMKERFAAAALKPLHEELTDAVTEFRQRMLKGEPQMMTVNAESSPDEIRTWLLERVAHYLDRPIAKIAADAELAEYGMDSVYSMSIIAEVEDALLIKIDEMAVWKYGTVNALVEYAMTLVRTPAPLS